MEKFSNEIKGVAQKPGDYYLSPATDLDFGFVYQLKKIAYREYIEQTWGWDDAFQIKFHRENFSAAITQIIKAGETSVGSVDVKEGPTHIFVSGLYLLPEYQSKGIGTSIIKDIINQAAERNKKLELEVLKVNAKAIKLYERLGFTKAERDKQKYLMFI